MHLPANLLRPALCRMSEKREVGVRLAGLLRARGQCRIAVGHGDTLPRCRSLCSRPAVARRLATLLIVGGVTAGVNGKMTPDAKCVKARVLPCCPRSSGG